MHVFFILEGQPASVQPTMLMQLSIPPRKTPFLRSEAWWRCSSSRQSCQRTGGWQHCSPRNQVQEFSELCDHNCWRWGPPDEVKVGRYYDPARLHVSLFDLDKDWLVQHNIIDEDEKLVPCWTLYDRLCLGTFVLCKVTLHGWNIGNCNGKFKRVRSMPVKILSKSTDCHSSILSMLTPYGSWKRPDPLPNVYLQLALTVEPHPRSWANLRKWLRMTSIYFLVIESPVQSWSLTSRGLDWDQDQSTKAPIPQKTRLDQSKTAKNWSRPV